MFTRPPFLCVEILSPEDRMSRVMRVVHEYLAMGVSTVWVPDPLEKKAYMADAGKGFREVSDQIAASDQGVVLTLSEIFSEEEFY